MVRLFGPLELETPTGGRLGPRDLGGAKPRRLLEVLLSERGRRVSKSALASSIWDDQRPRSMEATIETYVSILRKACGDPKVITTVERGYRVDSQRLSSDLDEFDRLALAGTLDSLQAALALADRGEILQHDPLTPWALSLQEEYRSGIGRIAGLAGERALEAGLFSRAANHLELAILRDPEGEQHYRRLMLASYLMGDRSRALRTYERLRRIASGIGLDPLPQTRDLHRRMLRGEVIRIPAANSKRVLVVESDTRYRWPLVQCVAAAGCLAELASDFSPSTGPAPHLTYDAIVAGIPAPLEHELQHPFLLVSKPFSPPAVTDWILERLSSATDAI